MSLPLLFASILSLASTGVESSAPAAPSTGGDAPAVASPRWYVAAAQGRSGPFTDVQLADDYVAGRVLAGTQVWHDGDASWVPLGEHVDFAALDQWYLGQGERVIGPMSGTELRRMLDEGRAQGRDLGGLSVRTAWSPGWTPLAQAVPLRAASTVATEGAPAPSVSRTPVKPGELDDRRRRVHRLRIGGAVLLGVGGGLIVLGGGLAGGYSSGAIGAGGLWAGVGMACVGVGPAIAGIVMVGVANRKQRNLGSGATVLRSLRPAAIAGRGQLGMSLSGRF